MNETQLWPFGRRWDVNVAVGNWIEVVSGKLDLVVSRTLSYTNNLDFFVRFVYAEDKLFCGGRKIKNFIWVNMAGCLIPSSLNFTTYVQYSIYNKKTK